MISPGPIASLALDRLRVDPGNETILRARNLEAILLQKDFSQGNFSALAEARLLASTTLLKETYVPGPAIDNWKAANQFLVEALSSGLVVDTTFIREVHRSLHPESRGELRTTFVQSGNTYYPEADSLPFLWKRFEEKLAAPSDSALLQASVLYQWIVTMHFFSDANGRLARLIADAVLLSAGLPPLSYENDVAGFVSALAEPDFFTVDDAIARVCEGVTHSMKILQG